MIIKDIQIDYIVVGMVQTNCYIIHRENSDQCVIADPGDRADTILKYLDEKGLTPEAILLTHGHFDHILAVAEIAAAKGCPVIVCDKEAALLADATQNCTIMGTGKAYALQADRMVKDGEQFSVAGMNIKVIHTPGHTSGSCCYYFEEGFALCGDTIFLESVGRTDLPTGNDYQIIPSIEEKIYALPDDTVLFPGHGQHTSVGYEKKNNPYTNGGTI